MPRRISDIPTRALRTRGRRAADVPLPIATAILDRLFLIEDKLERVLRAPPAHLEQLDRQARALVELRMAVELARAAFVEEQRVTRSAVALHLGDPGRGDARVVGRA